MTLLNGTHARQKTTQLSDPTALIKRTVALGDESSHFDCSNITLLDQWRREPRHTFASTPRPKETSIISLVLLNQVDNADAGR